MTTALIVVDAQNDFVHPDGNLSVEGAVEAVGEINGILGNYSNVFYTKDFHPPVTEHFADHGGPWPEHCVAATWGAEFYEGLTVIRNAPVVHKGMRPDEDGYSGFFVEADSTIEPTSLHKMLQAYGITAVDVVGIALDVCVKATALDAHALGYKTAVIVNATAPVTPEGGAEALTELANAGITVR